MIVKLFDGSEFVVSQERADEIAAGMAKKDNLIRLGGGIVRSSAIALIKPGGYSEADLPKPTNAPRLKADNRSDDEQFKAARHAADIARKRLQKRGILRKV